MKRSEAVDIIAKALRRWNGAFYDESLESFILFELEVAGMLPPNTFLTNEPDYAWESEYER